MENKKVIFKDKLKLALVFLILLLPFIWLRGGFKSIYLDLDMARDIHEISNIWIGRIVWLGPELRSNFHITLFCYYLFYPALWLGGAQLFSSRYLDYVY